MHIQPPQILLSCCYTCIKTRPEQRSTLQKLLFIQPIQWLYHGCTRQNELIQFSLTRVQEHSQASTAIDSSRVTAIADVSTEVFSRLVARKCEVAFVKEQILGSQLSSSNKKT